MIVWDYSDLDFNLDILSRYTTVALFAWSLGVFAASVVLPFKNISLAIAVNGTENPVDDKFGIPESVFSGTTETLNERNLLKFRKRMAGKDYETLKDRFPDIPVENLKEQLNNIHGLSGNIQVSGNWTKVYIGCNDAIFPPANQVEAWKRSESRPEIVMLEANHYVDLNCIVQGAVPAKEKIGARFRKALPTYDSQASAQKEIAKHLLNMIPAISVRDVIEVGPGTGIFTYLFSKWFTPAIIDFVDLYPLPAFGVAPTERYHMADAEDWFESESRIHAGIADMIVSASAMQWFVNPKRFFRNVSMLLREGGIMACSGFLPGNLEELKRVNPFGLTYRCVRELKEMLNPYFEDIVIEEKMYKLEFDSPRDLLRHIKDTGVGGSSVSGMSLRELTSLLPDRLTYRPVFIIARKKS